MQRSRLPQFLVGGEFTTASTSNDSLPLDPELFKARPQTPKPAQEEQQETGNSPPPKIEESSVDVPPQTLAAEHPPRQLQRPLTTNEISSFVDIDPFVGIHHDPEAELAVPWPRLPNIITAPLLVLDPQESHLQLSLSQRIEKGWSNLILVRASRLYDEFLNSYMNFLGVIYQLDFDLASATCDRRQGMWRPQEYHGTPHYFAFLLKLEHILATDFEGLWPCYVADLESHGFGHVLRVYPAIEQLDKGSQDVEQEPEQEVEQKGKQEEIKMDVDVESLDDTLAFPDFEIEKERTDLNQGWI